MAWRLFGCIVELLEWFISLQWRHNGRDSVSNHRPHDCLLNGLFRRRWKKTWKLRVTGLCAGNSPGTGEFPAQMASNAEKVSIWWRHHVLPHFKMDVFTYPLMRLKLICVSKRGFWIVPGFRLFIFRYGNTPSFSALLQIFAAWSKKTPG